MSEDRPTGRTAALGGRTFLDTLVTSVKGAATYNRGVMVGPAAILWPDEARQWEPLLPLLRELLPSLVTLGPYAPDERTGPAIWIRCLLAGELEAKGWPNESTPVLYLPGVSRQMLRAVETCPRDLQPLAELQYRGALWSQPNARDWTVVAFLKSKDGLGLDVAQDKATLDAIQRSLHALANASVEALSGRRLEAADFDHLNAPDPARDLLRWIDEPGGTRASWGEERWSSFCAISKQEFGLDPVAEGTLIAAEQLARAEGAWRALWTRFEEAPTRYPGIITELRRVQPRDLLFPPRAIPAVNEREENRLREALGAVREMAPADAAKRVLELEKVHGERREWIWARVGEADLAVALAPLARIAVSTTSAPGGSDCRALGEAYADDLWRLDDAALRAIAAVKTAGDRDLVFSVLAAVYAPWLDLAARRFQDVVRNSGYPVPPKAGVACREGECVFFVDALRMDVGHRLAESLRGLGLDCALEPRWSALPSVTPTSKHAVSPVAGLLSGRSFNEDFLPCIDESEELLYTNRFRKLLADQGFQVLLGHDVGTGKGRAWAEHGEVDQKGHEQGWKLALRVDELVDELTERVVGLLEAGWRSVRVVTDHGWLMLPSGLPRVELPKFLASTKWSRCAVLETTAHVDYPIVDWHWSNTVRVAVPHGIACFKANRQYVHGGLTLQECLTPMLVVSGGAVDEVATIDELVWRGLRCRVAIGGSFAGLSVDIRTKPADASSSVGLSPRSVDDEGRASLVVPRDELEGSAAYVVVVSATGAIVAKAATCIGGD